MQTTVFLPEAGSGIDLGTQKPEIYQGHLSEDQIKEVCSRLGGIGEPRWGYEHMLFKKMGDRWIAQFSSFPDRPKDDDYYGWHGELIVTVYYDYLRKSRVDREHHVWRYSTKINDYISSSLGECMNLARANPRTPVHMKDVTRQIWNSMVVRSQTGKNAVLDHVFHYYKGRCGPDSFGLMLNPEYCDNFIKMLENKNLLNYPIPFDAAAF